MRHSIHRAGAADFGTLPLFELFSDVIELAPTPGAPTIEAVNDSHSPNDDLQAFDFEGLLVELPPLSDGDELAPLEPLDLADVGDDLAPRDVVSSLVQPTVGPRNTRNYAQSSEAIPSGPKSKQARVDANIAALALRAQILGEGRAATEQEKTILAGYSGWGGLPTAFLPEARDRLTSVLSEEEYEAARAGMLTQHFTPDWVIDFMYGALRRLGVKPARMLDPACGNGLFAGRIPSEWKDSVAIHAAEIDPILASITQLLHPDVKVHAAAFEKVRLPNDTFDLVITNVPFAEVKPFDEETPALSLATHNFFISKALRKTRPGGMVAVVTSAFTMDAKGNAVRELIARQADLVAAARLPNWTFQATANTEVAADVLFLRKRMADDMVPLAPAWIASEYENDSWVNKALNDNPDAWCLGGRQVIKAKFGNRHTAAAGKHDVDEHVSQWVQALPEGKCATPEVGAYEEAQIGEQLELAHLRHLRFGAFAVHNGAIVQMDAAGNPQVLRNLTDAKADRIHAYISVRDAVKRLLLTQSQTAEDAPSTSARYELNCRYDAFVARFKPINARFNRSLLRQDPDYPLVSSLEIYEEDEMHAEKAAIFRQRTVRPRKKVTQAGNALEALAVSLNYSAKVDMRAIAKLCGKPEDAVAAELLEKGRVFRDPQAARWQLAEEYLSGDIVQKLEAARFAAGEDPRYEHNVQALQAAMPTRIPYADISVQLGSTFVRSEYIAAFIDHLMDNGDGKVRAAEVVHTPTLAKWKVTPCAVEFGNDRTRWGTSRVTAMKLVEMSLSMMTPTVRDRVPGQEDKYVVNADATLAAREKQMLIQEEFKTWIWRDEERALQIEEVYNRTFNATKPFVADGSHLTLPGLNEAITLRQSQKNGIWRNLIGGNTLIGHWVGAGKTLVGICTAMELKRLGLRRCTIIATPNNIVGQFAREFLNAYPCANLLVIEPDDTGRENREFLLGRLATGNYDAVIMAHSTFGSFGVSSQQLQAVTRGWYDNLAVAEASTSDRNALKDIERRRKTLDAFVDRIEADARKCSLTFDQLGCDQLVIDESQAFKNLWYTTSMERVAGLPSTFSRRAFDMFIKVRAVSAAHSERGGVVFMSATPIANTVAEMYHLMRYMAMPLLVEKGIDHFDAWAANFGRTVVNIETTPEGGGFRLQTRFARFDNLPELMALFGSFADIQTKEDLQLPTPKVAGGKPAVVTVPASKALKAYIKQLVKRAEAIRGPDKKKRPHPSVDNMLKVTTDGRLAALDMRLVGGSDDPASKLNVAVANIARIWKETADKRLTQLVFCDVGTPGNARCDLYQDIKDKLIAQGVTEREIAFVHDFDTATRLALLQARMNRGDIRVLIASTEKAGIGFNVQRLLYAEHELDCPWRPDQVDQRGGRIERQGNLNEEVLMFRYITEQSFDAYNWNLIEQKMRFILQVITSKCTVRSAEDIEVRALSVAEVKALATGNPKIVERALLQQKEVQLEALSRAFYQEQTLAAQRAGLNRSNIGILQRDLDGVQEDVITASATQADAPIVIMGKLYTSDRKDDIAEALKNAFADVSAENARMTRNDKRSTVFEMGAYRGFKLGICGAMDFLTGSLRYEWCLEGSLRWGTELGADWRGNYTRIRNLAERLPDELAKRKLKLEQTQKALQDVQAAGTAIFPRAAELSAVREQLRQVEDELGIADLDAQAAAVEADPSEDEAAVDQA